MKKLLVLLAVAEAVTGMILLVYPQGVIWLLFDSTIVGAGAVMSRLAGVSLIAFGVACWPETNIRRAFLGMLTWSMLAMVYLTCVGISGVVGILLWPAVAAHAGLAAVLVWMWRKERYAPGANT